MSSITGFNWICNKTEDALTTVAALLPPVALVKTALGTTQAITALVLGILSLPGRFLSDDAKAFNKHCWTHVIHGLGNVAASLVEVIPFVGFLFLVHRGECHKEKGFFCMHRHKYIPYADVVNEDLAQAKRDFPSFFTDLSSTSIKNPTFLSPTQFRQVTGFNAIPV